MAPGAREQTRTPGVVHVLGGCVALLLVGAVGSVALMAVAARSDAMWARAERCRWGHSEQCMVVARALEAGTEPEPDFAHAVELYDRACLDFHLPACARLRELAEEGRIAATDLTSDPFSPDILRVEHAK